MNFNNILGDVGARLDKALASKGDSPVLRGLGTEENALRFMRACLRGSYLFGRHLVPSYMAHSFAWLTTRPPVHNNIGPTLKKVVDLCVGELCTNNIFNKEWECHAHFHDLWDSYIEVCGDDKANEFARFMGDANSGTLAAIRKHPGLWSKGSTMYAEQLLVCCEDRLATFMVMCCNEMLTTIIYPVALKYLSQDAKFDKFRRFLEVHVQLDGDDHGLAAMEWLEVYLRNHLDVTRSGATTASMVLGLYERD